MIFLDRSIPKSIAEALKSVRRTDILWLEDRFPHNAKDEDWLPVAGQEEWLVIARDKKIRTRPRERDLVRAHGVGIFIINQKRDPSLWDYFKLMAACLDEMERLFAETPRPFMYLLDSSWRFRNFPLS